MDKAHIAMMHIGRAGFSRWLQHSDQKILPIAEITKKIEGLSPSHAKHRYGSDEFRRDDNDLCLRMELFYSLEVEFFRRRDKFVYNDIDGVVLDCSLNSQRKLAGKASIEAVNDFLNSGKRVMITNHDVNRLSHLRPREFGVILPTSKQFFVPVRLDSARDAPLNIPHWPAPGSEDTELGVFMEPEVSHGETEVYPRVQA